jgi:hypothetical protein
VQTVTIRCQVSRPFKNDFALLGKAFKTPAMFDDLNAKLDLKLLNGSGKGRLRNSTDRCCPSKMTFLGERDQVFKFPRNHSSLVTRSSVPWRIMQFADQAALDAYPQHAAHQALLQWLVPLIRAIELDLTA